MYRAGTNFYAAVFVPDGFDPFGLYELEWEGENWTRAQKEHVTRAINVAGKRAGELIREIRAKIASFSPCVRKELEQELTPLLDALEAVKEGFQSRSENLELSHYAFEPARPETEAEAWAAGWYGYNGFFSDAQIDLNDAANAPTWVSGGDDNAGRLMLHELSHLYGTEDDDTKGPWMNAHNIQRWFKNAFGGAEWPNSVARAKKKCARKKSCPRKWPFPPSFPVP